VSHTPDYFVIHEDSAGWEECKTADDLEKLAIKNPHRYRRNTQGQWCCPPGEAYAAKAGLYYRVRSSAEINWVLQRNLQFLEDYLRFDCASVTAFVNEAIKAVVADQPGILLANLLEQMVEVTKHDDIYLLIASGQLYADLGAAAIAEPEKLRVFRDIETAAAYSRACPDQKYEIENNGITTPSGTAKSEGFRLLASAGEQDLKTANERFAYVKRHQAGEAIGCTCKDIALMAGFVSACQGTIR
jgi:hypothetical protein